MSSLFLDKANISEQKEGVQNEAKLNQALPGYALDVALLTIQEGFSTAKATIDATIGENSPDGMETLQSWQGLYETAKGLS